MALGQFLPRISASTTVAITNGRKQLSQDEVAPRSAASKRAARRCCSSMAATVREQAQGQSLDCRCHDLEALILRPGFRIKHNRAVGILRCGRRDGRLSVNRRRRRGVGEPLCVAPLLSRCRLVVGKGADSQKPRIFLALLEPLSRRSRAVTKAAIFVGERRWETCASRDGSRCSGCLKTNVGNALGGGP